MKVFIDGKEIELELTEKQKAVVERALRPQTGWERAPRMGKYHYINGISIGWEGDDRCPDDDDFYKNANYFSSEELAENIDRAQTLQRQLWRRSAELCEKVNWCKKDTYKWVILYDKLDGEFFITDVYSVENFGQVYFDTPEHAEQVLGEFRDELTWYFTEFKSRMD